MTSMWCACVSNDHLYAVGLWVILIITSMSGIEAKDMNSQIFKDNLLSPVFWKQKSPGLNWYMSVD